MANYDMTQANGPASTHQGAFGSGREPYVVEIRVTGAAAATAKGSALVATDVLQVLDLPAETLVREVIAEVETADTGTTLTFDIDIAAGDDLMDGIDGTTAGYPVPGTNGVTGYGNAVATTAADTLDMKVASLTSANDDWVIRLLVTLQDISGKNEAAAAQSLNS